MHFLLASGKVAFDLWVPQADNAEGHLSVNSEWDRRRTRVH